MTETKDKLINTTIAILGKLYPIRCPESEVASLQEAANFLNREMTNVQESGKVINLERIAIIAALNITHQYLQIEQHKNSLSIKINQRIKELQDKLDKTIKKTRQTDLLTPSD